MTAPQTRPGSSRAAPTTPRQLQEPSANAACPALGRTRSRVSGGTLVMMTLRCRGPHPQFAAVEAEARRGQERAQGHTVGRWQSLVPRPHLWGARPPALSARGGGEGGGSTEHTSFADKGRQAGERWLYFGATRRNQHGKRQVTARGGCLPSRGAKWDPYATWRTKNNREKAHTLRNGRGI